MAKLYRIIGGPLDGKRANFASFKSPRYELMPHPNPDIPWRISDTTKPIPGTGGPYFPYRDEYAAFNRNGVLGMKKTVPSMVFLHVSLVGA